MNKFRPVEMNKENFDILFQACIADEHDEHADVYTADLFMGENKSGNVIRFSKHKLDAHKKTFDYLIGQFSLIHNPETMKMYSLSKGNVLYTGENFTINVYRQFALLNMALYFKVCSPIIVVDDEYLFHSSAADIKPTLSPNDPSFEDWWRKHRKEWDN